MIAPPRPTRRHPFILLAACLLAVAAGCRHGHRGDGDDGEGHVIPAHKPRSFEEAVRRSRALRDRIAARIAAGGPAPPAEGDDLAVALDIADWLPEIAADTDMPEAPWNEVEARARSLAAAYRGILGAADAGPPGGEAAALRAASAAIAGLERVLAEADPRWFVTGVVADSP